MYKNQDELPDGWL